MTNGSLKKLFILSVVSYVTMVLSIFYILKEVSYNYTFENLQDNLRNVKALRQFVSLEQKEEVYNLQKQQVISTDYFKPQLLSSTYCSKTVNTLYNDIRNKENLNPIVLRFASDNPRNTNNKANKFEEDILKRFNNREITSYKEIKYNEDGKKVLYYALPSKPLKAKCMRCHSTPDKAPKELLRIYGDKNGFHEKQGSIRAIISTEYPLEKTDKFIFQSTLFLSLIAFIILLVFVLFYINFSKKLLKTNMELKEFNETLEDKVKEETYALKTSNTQLENVINGSELGYWDWNLQTGYHDVNKKWLDILGLEREDIKHNQSDWEERIHEEDKKAIMPIIQSALNNQHTYTVEFRMKHKDGHYVWIEGSGGIIERDKDGKPLRACGTHKDISQRKQNEMDLKKKHKQLQKAQKELKKLVITDKLTGLYNRHKLDNILKKEKSRSDRYNTPFGIILLDIDYFKSINDTYGHNVGDEVLREFAKILLNNSREPDIIGRWGGEEFLIIVPQTNKDAILQFAHILKDKIEKTSFETVGKTTASFGVSMYKKDELTDNTLSRADDALYISKKNGRNQINYKD